LNFITIELANKLPTKRLLQYYKRIRKTTFGLAFCGCGCGCHIGELAGNKETSYYSQYKNYLIYDKHRCLIKKILDTREHIKRKGNKMNLWICKKCGHEVLSETRPNPIKWTDGHICYFIEGDKK